LEGTIVNDREYAEFIAQEYQEVVTALARKYLRMQKLLSEPPAEGEEPYERTLSERLPLLELDKDVEHLISTALLVRAVRERAEAGRSFSVRGLDIDAYEMLGHEVKLAGQPAHRVTEHLNNIGLLEALDDAGRTDALRLLPRTAIPDEDLNILRRCGVEDPEAEITILSRILREDYQSSSSFRQSLGGAYGYFKECASRLEEEGGKMENPELPPPESPKKRKILNGVGNLLVGFATAGGNALMGAGTIAAPNPATGYLVISSSALAIGAFFKGLGDLRGE
jgi:hypothetical protein